MAGDIEETDELAARIAATPPRRLTALAGAFVFAIAALMFLEARSEADARRTETTLRVERAANACAAALDIAILTGDSARAALVKCHPGGRAVVLRLSEAGDILSVYGATDRVDLDPATLLGLPLDRSGDGVLDLSTGKARAFWRPLNNGEAALVAAPAADMFARTPVFFGYGLMLAAVAIGVFSLLLAFLRQTRNAKAAAEAIAVLADLNEALAGGRASPWFYDGKARAVTLSRVLLEPLGQGARDRALDMRELAALVHPEDLRKALAVVTGEPSGMSESAVRLRKPAGEWSRILLRTAPDAARLKRAGIAVDLSAATSADEGALRDLVKMLPEIFVLWGADGRLALWNRRFESVFRFPDGALSPGLSARDVFDRAGVRSDIVAAHFAPEAPDDDDVEVELPNDRWLRVLRRRTCDGGTAVLAGNRTQEKRRARFNAERERKLKATVDDLEKSRAEALRDYEAEKRRAEEASRSKSEFLANMSHELRTPLNAINGFSEIMRAELYGPLGDEKYKEYVEDILASGRRLLELIDDVLDMSKIEAGKLALDPKRVEMDKVLQDCMRLVEKRAVEAGVRLAASVGHAPAAWADARAARQVVLNLLSNAIKFTPPGGEIAITAEADLDGVTVIVADSGVGIDKDKLKSLGAPFALVEDHFSRSAYGSGLGLALAKSLMEMQGGILAIASQPGKGTVACAAFPRRKEARVRLPQFVRAEAHVLTAARAAPVLEPPRKAPEAA
jgi:two-component system cell cycle sensor histidine kinase PleC